MITKEPVKRVLRSAKKPLPLPPNIPYPSDLKKYIKRIETYLNTLQDGYREFEFGPDPNPERCLPGTQHRAPWRTTDGKDHIDNNVKAPTAFSFGEPQNSVLDPDPDWPGKVIILELVHEPESKYFDLLIPLRRSCWPLNTTGATLKIGLPDDYPLWCSVTLTLLTRNIPNIIVVKVGGVDVKATNIPQVCTVTSSPVYQLLTLRRFDEVIVWAPFDDNGDLLLRKVRADGKY